jgi:hypothetical protein
MGIALPLPLKVIFRYEFTGSVNNCIFKNFSTILNYSFSFTRFLRLHGRLLKIFMHSSREADNQFMKMVPAPCVNDVYS